MANTIKSIKVGNENILIDYSSLANKPTIPSTVAELSDSVNYIKTTDEVITNIGKKYEKPENGIPLSDIAEGVIPNVSEFISENRAEEIAEEKVSNATSALTENISNLQESAHTHTNKTILDGLSSEKITEWDNKSNFSGSYNDLTNKPIIPSEVTEDTVSGWGFTKNAAYDDTALKNRVTAIENTLAAAINFEAQKF